jgi:hypothetical protein
MAWRNPFTTNMLYCDEAAQEIIRAALDRVADMANKTGPVFTGVHHGDLQDLKMRIQQTSQDLRGFAHGFTLVFLLDDTEGPASLLVEFMANGMVTWEEISRPGTPVDVIDQMPDVPQP